MVEMETAKPATFDSLPHAPLLPQVGHGAIGPDVALPERGAADVGQAREVGVVGHLALLGHGVLNLAEHRGANGCGVVPGRLFLSLSCTGWAGSARATRRETEGPDAGLASGRGG